MGAYGRCRLKGNTDTRVMTLLTPNLDTKGRLLRAGVGVLLLLLSFAFSSYLRWGMIVAGFFCLWEAYRGW
ncbi:MAG: hypothetical protein NZ959_02540 [Armatimonadetes bacterium]|nr:hypothetical protein [Armatimonadota bacterium]MDW8120949.1 hypothetical protein [Armatimonadota bacterium]